MKSLDIEEQLEADVYDSLPSRNDSSSGDGTKRKSSSYRSKHSESEQRRRSKINERFQTLMDIIPLNDQKRDKASFLLEVIEYIQFLQEKLDMYEKSHQLWNQGPTKLIPWRNNHRLAEEVSDHSQIIKSWSGHDKGGSSPGLLSDNVVESASVMKILDQNFIASFTPARPQLQIAQLDSAQARPSSGSVTCNRNESSNLNRNTSAGLSTICSQGILNTLTKELKSLGVNMSETMISVDVSLGKRKDLEFPIAASEENGNSILHKERSSQDPDHAQKRIRR